MEDLPPPPKPPFAACLVDAWRPLLLLALMVCLGWWFGDNAAHNYRWQWYRVWSYLGTWGPEGFKPGMLLVGLTMTLKLTLISLGLALVIGLVLAVMRLSASPAARFLAGIFLGTVRNTPLLMQLFIVYFVVAPVLGLGQFASACLALAAFEGSYMAEIFRAGVVSLPKSQWEAALSLGMSMLMVSRLVILPQALHNIIAPLASQIISLIKDTSLVSSIAIVDLTMRARVIITDTFMSFEIWLLTAVIYLCLTMLVSLPAKWLERKSEL